MTIPQLIRSTLDAISMVRPNGHALDVQHIPLATRLLPPSPYSRRAYRPVGTVAVSNSASGVVRIKRAVGEVVKAGRGSISSWSFLV